MKKYIKIAAAASQLLLSALSMCAQDTISLDGAIGRAMKHRDEIKIKIGEADASVSENEVSKIKSRFLPNLNASIDSRYYGNIPTQIIPADAFGGPAGTDRKVQFGTTYTSSGALDLTIPIYNPGDRADRRVAGIQAAYDKLSVKKTEIDIRLEVCQSYFNLLMVIEKLHLSKSNVDNTLAVYRMSKDQLDKGAILGNDLEKIRLNYESAKSEYEKNQNNYGFAQTDLAYRMGLDSAVNFHPLDSIAGISDYVEDLVSGNNPEERIEIKQQKLLVRKAEENIQREKNSRWPTISAYGNLSAQELSHNYALFDAKTWYPYNYFGIRASVPIFDGSGRQRTRRGYELQMRSAQLTVSRLQKDYKHEMQSAANATSNDKRDIEVQRNNLHNVMELYQTDSDRLQRGTIKPTDLTTTYYLVLQSQNAYLNALYVCLLDMLQYQKATGLL